MMKRRIELLSTTIASLIANKIVAQTGSAGETRSVAAQDRSAVSVQTLIRLHYHEMVHRSVPLPAISDVGYRVYSQTDEDGIILYLFAVAGTRGKVFVEIGAGDGQECNCSNLAVNFGWHGLFIDGNPAHVESGRKFYSESPDTRLFPPQFVCAKVTRDNINQVIMDAGFSGEIDFLSIDIDGMDYWIWEALDCVQPRIVVVEANGKLGARSITVPYDPDWTYDAERTPHYHGASLPAFAKLAEKKGYRLVGTNKYGYNAFFVKHDVAPDLLSAVSVESCRTHPTRKNDEFFFGRISHLPFVEI